VNVEFLSYKDTKYNPGKSFAKVILFSEEILLSLGDIKHETLEIVVHKMYKKGKNAFDGINPFPFENL
jgi:hypothetical protein